MYSNIYLLIFFIFSTLLGVLGYYERIAEKKWQKITLYILLCMYLLVNMGNFLYTSWKDNVSKNNQRVNSDVIEMLTTKQDNTYNELITAKNKLSSLVNRNMMIRNISLTITYEFQFENEKDVKTGKYGLTTTPFRDKLAGMYNGKLQAVFAENTSLENISPKNQIILFSDSKWYFEYPTTKSLAVKIKFETSEDYYRNVEWLEKYRVLVLPFKAIIETLRRELRLPNPLQNTTIYIKIFLNDILYDDLKVPTSIPFDTNQFVLRTRNGIFYNVELKYMEVLGIDG